MATTTNYGWTTPDDTALVKDGAAAIRTLGSSVDTTTKNLNPSTTLGDIEYRSSTANTNTRLGIGSTGQILTVAGGVPSWATPAASGGITLITETVANANSSISFTSISSSYKQLLLVWDGIYHSTTGSIFSLRMNNSSGNVYNGLTHSNATTTGNAVGTFHNAQSYVAEGSGLGLFGRATDIVTPISYHVRGWFLIDNYASTTKMKPYRTEFEYGDNSGATQVIGARSNGSFSDTTAVTSLDIVRLSGSATITNSADTSIRLYGVS
jgi:hypothetical protein